MISWLKQLGILKESYLEKTTRLYVDVHLARSKLTSLEILLKNLDLVDRTETIIPHDWGNDPYMEIYVKRVNERTKSKKI